MLMGFAVEHGLADDRLLVDAERELLEVDLERVVLRQHEVQPLLGRLARAERRRRILLEHVDAAGVGARHLARLLEDEREQLADVALRRQRARRRDELRHLVAEPVGDPLKLLAVHGARRRQCIPVGVILRISNRGRGEVGLRPTESPRGVRDPLRVPRLSRRP